MAGCIIVSIFISLLVSLVVSSSVKSDKHEPKEKATYPECDCLHCANMITVNQMTSSDGKLFVFCGAYQDWTKPPIACKYETPKTQSRKAETEGNQ